MNSFQNNFTNLSTEEHPITDSKANDGRNESKEYFNEAS